MAQHTLLVVSYHYVREPSGVRYPGIHPISPERLAEHVRVARRRFEVVTPARAEAFLARNEPLDGPSVLFSFDDALADQWHAAEAVLGEFDVKAAFFASTRPHVENRALLVNKLQFVRSITPPEAFARRFMAAAPPEARLLADNAAFRNKAAAVYVHDDAETGCVKYLANFALAGKATETIVDALLDEHGVGQAELCERLYMSADQLRALHSDGHLIGCHGHVHRPFGTMHPREAMRDLARNRAILSRLVGAQPRWVSYPYGRGDALPLDCAGLCEGVGLDVGLTLIRGWNGPDADPHAVRRVTENQYLDMLDHFRQRSEAA